MGKIDNPSRKAAREEAVKELRAAERELARGKRIREAEERLREADEKLARLFARDYQH